MSIVALQCHQVRTSNDHTWLVASTRNVHVVGRFHLINAQLLPMFSSRVAHEPFNSVMLYRVSLLRLVKPSEIWNFHYHILDEWWNLFSSKFSVETGITTLSPGDDSYWGFWSWKDLLAMGVWFSSYRSRQYPSRFLRCRQQVVNGTPPNQGNPTQETLSSESNRGARNISCHYQLFLHSFCSTQVFCVILNDSYTELFISWTQQCCYNINVSGTEPTNMIWI